MLYFMIYKPITVRQPVCCPILYKVHPRATNLPGLTTWNRITMASIITTPAGFPGVFPWIFSLFQENRSRETVLKINKWIEKKSKNDPDAILSGYRLNGANLKDNDYTTLAFIAPLTVSLMTDRESQEWLDDMFESLISKKFGDYKYFDNTINLLSLLVLSGNYWTPAFIK